jgi:hypothetical protein
MNFIYLIAFCFIVYKLIRYIVDGTEPNLKHDLRGKVFMITGSSDGIGVETAIMISKMGGTIVHACRNEAKAREVIKKIEAITNNKNVRQRLN